MAFQNILCFPNARRFFAVVRQKTEDRLATTCFRGMSRRLAGNFSRWSSPAELFGDSIIQRRLIETLEELDGNLDFGTHSITIEYGSPVGWSSTAPRKNYSAGELIERELNHRSFGRFVKPTRACLPAPRTNKLTLVFEFKWEGTLPVAVIHSIYPGEDVGELEGNVSARENVVFFDWNHPGE